MGVGGCDFVYWWCSYFLQGLKNLLQSTYFALCTSMPRTTPFHWEPTTWRSRGTGIMGTRGAILSRLWTLWNQSYFGVENHNFGKSVIWYLRNMFNQWLPSWRPRWKGSRGKRWTSTGWWSTSWKQLNFGVGEQHFQTHWFVICLQYSIIDYHPWGPRWTWRRGTK